VPTQPPAVVLAEAVAEDAERVRVARLEVLRVLRVLRLLRVLLALLALLVLLVVEVVAAVVVVAEDEVVADRVRLYSQGGIGRCSERWSAIRSRLWDRRRRSASCRCRSSRLRSGGSRERIGRQ
jgi:hypothetical protein